jgi:hypothetical protein
MAFPSLANRFLKTCLHTRGLRRLGREKLAPAFFYPERGIGTQRFGPLPADLRAHTGGAIMIAHYPKSGSTWLDALVGTVLDIPFGRTEPEYQGTRLLRTSSRLDPDKLFDPKLLRGAVLVRDLRDIVVSLYHYTRVEHFLETEGPTHIFNTVEDMYYGYFVPYYAKHVCDPCEFWRDYVEYGWPVIRYERLIEDTAGELRRLFAIWDIAVQPDAIDQAVAANTLDKMKSGTGRSGDTVAEHFRRGIAGSHLDELPDNVRRDVERRFRVFMEDWGYL